MSGLPLPSRPALSMIGCLIALVAVCLPTHQAGAIAIAGQYRAAAFPTFAIEQVPNLPGGSYNKAFGLNRTGHVVGFCTLTSDDHAFLYRDGNVQDLGVPAGYTSSVAWGINGHEEFAMNVQSPTSSLNAYYARLKNGAVSWRHLLGANRKHVMDVVGAINESGDVSGTIFPSSGPQRAVTWRKSKSFSPTILRLPATATSSAGIDAERDVAVNSSKASGVFNPRAYVWEASQKLIRLPSLHGGNTEVWSLVRTPGPSVILAVGDTLAKNGRPQAAEWRISTSNSGKGSVAKLINLGHLPAYPRATAYAVNRNGWVAGSSTILTQTGEDEHAFLYRNGKMRDLNDLIPSPADWELQRAVAINGKGEIAGYGLYKGTYTSFLLTPH